MQLAKYHAIHAHNGWVPQSDLWLKMGKYFALIPKYLKDPEQNTRWGRKEDSNDWNLQVL